MITCFLAVWLMGCGKPGQIELYSTTGVVTLDGDPIANASVVFIPAADATSAKTAVGLTDEDGRFTVYTDGRRGACEATYTVTIFAQEDVGDTGAAFAKLSSEPGKFHTLLKRPKLLVPEKYTKAAQSGLSFDVEPCQNDFDIELFNEVRKPN